MKLTKEKLKDLIKNTLEESRERCEFKDMFLRDGITCIIINKFSESMSEIIVEAEKNG